MNQTFSFYTMACRLVIVLLASMMAITSTVSSSVAGVDQWTSIGPEGGTITSLAIDPATPSTVYAGTIGGVFKSTTGGTSWSPVTNGLTSSYVYALAIDPVTSSTVYAGTSGGVFRSTTGGASWSPASSGLTSTYVNTLAIDPAAPSTVYAGTSDGIFKSTTGGTSWSPISSGLTHTFIRALAIDPATPATIYAGSGDGVFKSTTGGSSWSPINSGLTNTSINALAIDPATPATIYAGTRDGVFMSTNGGVTWNPANYGLTSTVVYALAIDPDTPATIYAGTYDRVFRTSTGGASWEPVSNGLTSTFVYAVAIDPATPATLYTGTNYGGVFKSTTGGTSWIAVNNGLTSTFVNTISLDPVTPSTIYAGTGDGVFRSVTGGSSWSLITSGQANMYVTALAIDPATPTIIYAGTSYSGISKSTTGGTSWSPINNGLTNLAINTIVLDLNTPSTMYAGTSDGLFRSTNAGSSWDPLGNGLTNTYVYAVAIDPVTSATMYAGTRGGVFKSTNGGVSWSEVNSGLTSSYAYNVVIDPVSPSVIYAGTYGGVFKSTTGGDSWSLASTGLPNANVYALTIDPVAPATIYAGMYGSGVYRSTTGGTSWSPINTGFTNSFVRALAINSLNPRTIYAGTYGGSAFSYTLPVHNLQIMSSNPASGISIQINTTDTSGNSGGITPFSRTYLPSTAVQLTAPATAGSTYFSGWTGCDSVNGSICSVVITGDRAVTASYDPPPAAPSGVAVTPGNGQVQLSWSAVPGATSSNLYYAASPGVTKATGTKVTGVTNPCTIPGLTNGTTWYFVLTTVVNGVESAESGVVSAIPSLPAGSGYLQSDITGTWYGNSLASGSGAPWWERATATIASNGDFSATTLESDGGTSSLTGTFVVAPDGRVYLSGSSDTNMCRLDAGKTVMACTDTWTSGSPGTTEMKVLTKKATTYSQSDLSGEWTVNQIGTPGPHYLRGTTTIASNGSFTYSFTSDGTNIGPLNGTATINSNGVVTITVPTLSVTFPCNLDASKTVMACVNTDIAHNESLLTVYTKKAASYVQTDLAGSWGLNNLVTAPGAPWWYRANITINTIGVASGMGIDSDGSSEAISGVFTLSTTGGITSSLNPNLQCGLAASKTVAACTSLWTGGAPGTAELPVFTKVAVASPKTLTGLSVSGPPSLHENNTSTYVATASWSDGTSTTETPVWSVSPTTYASINGSGVLTATTVPSDQAITVTASYTSGGVTLMATQPVAIRNQNSSISVTIDASGSGSGTVTSDAAVNGTPADISCLSGTCSAQYPASTVVTLMATPSTLSIFGGWGGACTNVSGDCTVTLNADTSVTATFNAAPRAMIGTTGYPSVGAAYAAAASVATIKVLDTTHAEGALTFNKPTIVTLSGGWNNVFSIKSGLPTVLSSPLIIQNGTIVFDGITIR